MAHEGQFTLAIDEKNDVLYSLEFVPNPENTSFCNKIVIYKRQAMLKSVTLLRNLYNYRPLIEKVELSIDNIYISYLAMNYDRSSNAIYIVANNVSNYNIPSGSNIVVCRIPLDTLKLEKIVVANTTGGALYSQFCYVYVTELKIPSKYTSSNYHDVGIFERNGFLYFPQLFASGNDTQNYAVVDTKKNTVSITNCRTNLWAYNATYRIIPIIGNSIMFFRSPYRSSSPEAGTFYMQTNYLATINNLSSPVTKTAAQTMKVIYTISEG